MRSKAIDENTKHEIIKLFKQTDISQVELAAKYKIGLSTVQKILREHRNNTGRQVPTTRPVPPRGQGTSQGTSQGSPPRIQGMGHKSRIQDILDKHHITGINLE